MSHVHSYPAHYPSGVDWVHVEKIDSDFVGKELQLWQVKDIGLGRKGCNID